MKTNNIHCGSPIAIPWTCSRLSGPEEFDTETGPTVLSASAVASLLTSPTLMSSWETWGSPRVSASSSFGKDLRLSSCILSHLAKKERHVAGTIQ